MGAAPSDYRDEIRGQPAIDSLDKCIKSTGTSPVL